MHLVQVLKSPQLLPLKSSPKQHRHQQQQQKALLHLCV
jgi:hypothetical protein